MQEFGRSESQDLIDPLDVHDIRYRREYDGKTQYQVQWVKKTGKRSTWDWVNAERLPSEYRERWDKYFDEKEEAKLLKRKTKKPLQLPRWK